MYELIIVATWGLFALGAVIYTHQVERKEWQAERKELLNRLMARDYQQYIDKEIRTMALDRPMSVVGVEELVTRLQEHEREDLPAGMPV